MADYSGLSGYAEEFLVRRSTVSPGVLAALRLANDSAGHVPTGVCPVCRLRVPVLLTGRVGRHWPKMVVRRIRMVPARRGDMRMVTVCAGSEIEPAGLIQVGGETHG